MVEVLNPGLEVNVKPDIDDLQYLAELIATAHPAVESIRETGTHPVMQTEAEVAEAE